MLISRENLKLFCQILHQGNQKIVFTNGCFDIIHAGHVKYLNSARSLGDVLIVGLNSDKSVRMLKGESRPINNEHDRATVLEGLRAVDYVTIFDERTAEALITLVRPDVYAKGEDYTIDTLPEAKLVEEYGGKVSFIKFLAGHSTTGTIDKIKGQPQ
ncbi:MAG: D-glycero-beta-D-manno-heptose 1-phosphate adenylyltransferase [Schwartzia sp.]|nr:D-glycero-beta-D-manno-heptose 1-phosphate adenylyltransferase [Schwartzia sp. (in: firmicutes)]